MTPASPAVLICDYNGVIGRQPTEADWAGLAAAAGWTDADAFERAFWCHRESYDDGTLTPRGFWRPLLRGAATRADERTLIPLLSRLDVQMWLRVDREVLEHLHSHAVRGSRLILLSNAPHPVACAISATPWASYLFATQLYSCRLGVNKPHPRAFEAALAAAGVRAADTLLIDDRADNTASAARLGIPTLHYTGTPASLSRNRTTSHRAAPPLVLATLPAPTAAAPAANAAQ